MGEKTEPSVSTGCPCDRTDFPEDEVSACGGVTVNPSLPEYADESMMTLLPCIVCNRTFTPAALKRHRKVCEKLSTKIRNVFDATKKRLDEMDVPLGTRSRDPPTPKVKSKWRQKRAEFLRAIRAAKITNEDDEVGGEGHVPSDYIRCGNCARYFGPKSADRHIEWCQEQKNKQPKYSTQEDTQAVTRLKARTKYVPPRPGQSGWRAPKKKDVISSIPPQNMGLAHSPGSRLGTPPLPQHRHISPPPVSPSRKGSAVNVPAGPSRYQTGSLGRAAGKQFASMLQTVTGCSPGYGISSGYGSTAMYGSASGTSTPAGGSNFQRSASLRLPRKRYGNSQKMARNRDLASDMLASVTMGGKSKRLDPEGDEDTHSMYAMNTYDRMPSKIPDPHYDPFSAAEMQFQALLEPSVDARRKHGLSYGGSMLGSTSSLKHVGVKRDSPEREYRVPRYKPRSTSVGPGYHNMALLGLDSYDPTAHSSADTSPTDLRSPEDNLDDIFARFDNFKSPHFSPIRSPFRLSPSRSPTMSPSRISPSRTIPASGSTKNSPRARSVEPLSDLIASLEATAANRRPADGGHRWRKSPSPAKDTFNRKSKEGSPLRPSARDDTLKEHTAYGWGDNSSNNYSRHLGPNRATTLHAANSAYDSIKILRASLDEDLSLGKKSFDALDCTEKRISSGSSTDSSLPPLSSPSCVSVEEPKTPDTLAQLTRFCHECGHQYPVAVAKFCCQCGARRINVGD